MKCPHCGLINPETALRCDCGYDFATKQIKESYLTGRKSAVAVAERSKRKGLGSLSLAFKIVMGSLRLLSQYPKLVAPMVPVFILVLVISVSVSFAETELDIMVMLMAIFAAALKQISS